LLPFLPSRNLVILSRETKDLSVRADRSASFPERLLRQKILRLRAQDDGGGVAQQGHDEVQENERGAKDDVSRRSDGAPRCTQRSWTRSWVTGSPSEARSRFRWARVLCDGLSGATARVIEWR
jgi:hypothetical protein